jgi:hypothetical protein
MDPDYSDEPYAVKIVALSMNSVFICTWVACLTLAMIRIKCSVEKSGLVLIITYSINCVIRVVFDGIRLSLK